MENNNSNNIDWSVFQPATSSKNYNSNSHFENEQIKTPTMNNPIAQQIMDTTTIPQISVADKNYANTLPISNTNTSTTCTGNNCSLTPETLTNTDFFPAYLKKFIGHWVRLDFFMGNTIEQRVGQLLEVGASYVLIKLLEPQTIMMCDLYSIKFVTIILNDEFEKLFSF